MNYVSSNIEIVTTFKINKSIIFILIYCFCSFVIFGAEKFHIVDKEFLQTVWDTESGLPQNSVRAITRTRDGYLWIGTFEGLARFDGINFTTFNNINTPEFKSTFVKTILEDREGNLWIGIDGGGVVKRTANKFIHFSKSNGLLNDNVMCLLEDRNGNIWIGLDDGGLSVFRNGKFTNFTTQNGLPDNHIWSLAEDSFGSIWIATNKGLVQMKDSKFTTYTEAEGLLANIVKALWWNETDGLWIGTTKGLNRLSDGRILNFSEQNEISNQSIETLTEDNENNLWIGTRQKGLLYFNHRDKTAPVIINSLPDKFISSIYLDSENNLWVGSYYSGLYRFRKNRFRPISTLNSLMDENTSAVFEDTLGNLWFATDGKLSRVKNGILTVYKSKTLPKRISSIAEDKDNNIWIGGIGISQYKDNKFSQLKNVLPTNDIFCLISDQEGNIWIGTTNGLSVFRDGKFTHYTKKEGLVNNFIISLFSDQSGAIWIGTRDGLSRLKDEKFTNWTTSDGLANNHILSFYEESNGTIWIGTSGGGLSRFKDKKFTNITSQNGLYDNLTFQILNDGNGNLWMCGNKGIYRANLVELNDFADGRRTSVNSYSYGTADGMLSRECNGASPAGWKSKDGTIWFSTVKGLVSVDTTREDSPPPIVVIEQVKLNGQILENSETLQIKPRQENLEIQYTGISWQRPKQIKFKYKLEGLDHDWVDAETRRTAYYPHLPPGEYTFKIIADNGEGVWNLEGKSLKIQVLPSFHQTWWFILLCILIAFIGVVMIYRKRVNQLEKAKLSQEIFSHRLINAHESERHRIAAELHDGLGQSLVMIKNTAVYGKDVSKNLKTAKHQLEKISAQSAQAITEVREIAYNLRPYLLDRLGLTKAIQSLLNEVADIGALKIDSEVDEIDGLFASDADMSIYRIIQESLSNILKHSEANEVSVEIKRLENSITIKISDDGKGFDVNILNEENKSSGFGLLGISERVKILGGDYSFQSTNGRGTMIFISINLKDKQKETIQ